MKTLKILLITFLFLGITQSKSNEKNNEFKNKILKNIRCLICQGQSVYDSESDFASSIKLIVDKKIKKELSEEQIYEFLREKYGNWIIYDPKLDNEYFLRFYFLVHYFFHQILSEKNP